MPIEPRHDLSNAWFNYVTTYHLPWWNEGIFWDALNRHIRDVKAGIKDA